MSNDFVHLHVHSEYSLLDGSARLDGIVSRARDLGMPAVALTDHGVMYGVVDFYRRCMDAGIKPVLGCEVYVAPRTRHDREPRVDDDPGHLVVLAESDTGYRNLVKLVSRAYTEGLYYKPRVDSELLEEHREGLIVLSACLSGEIPDLVLRGREDEARARALWYRDVFGPENYFLELQDHGLADQKTVNRFLVELAQELGLGLVATNDAHYIDREDAASHDVLLCIQTGRSLEDEDRMRFPNNNFYLRPADEMARLFKDVPGALTNTVAIAERATVSLDFDSLYLPRAQLPEGFDDAGQFLRKLCLERLETMIPGAGAEVRERLEYELATIESMGYPGYFLIIWDFVEYARRRGIAVGPGRGSAAGCLVAYVLGITKVNPLDYGLPFERFLNPERVSLPDVDIDFCYERRDEIIEYVVDKYGADCVSKIVTFGTMAARAAIRDVGRALKMPYAEVDRIAKQVPAQLGVTLNDALNGSGELSSSYRERPEVKKLVDIARSLEGLPRHASVHAAGVVIADRPLTDYIPLQKMGDGSLVTQFPMDTIADLGLLKMDFLALRTLTMIEEAVRIIRHVRGEAVDPEAVSLDDALTYQLLSDGHTGGVFQLESSGMRDLLRRMKPGVIEDIIAAVALFRPGPMENIPLFLKQKHSRKIDYPHPLLVPILKETYGVIVYQEQIMHIASAMAGLTMGQAYILIKGISKKQEDTLSDMRQQFIDGCLEQGHDRALAEQIFDLIHKFAGYGFNKCHTTPYALLAYQTAYLKAHFPTEFMAALLTSVRDNTDKVAAHISECRRMGIDVLPPDVNESYANFTVVEGAVRFGLAAVKNVGMRLVEAIIAERESGPYRSLRDLCERVDASLLNRRALESLVKAGALDSLASRARLLPVLEDTLGASHSAQRELGRGQVSLFELGAGSDDSPWTADDLPDVPDLSPSQRLALEKEVLGVYLTGHPLAEFEEELRASTTHTIGALDGVDDEVGVRIAGLVATVKRVVTRGGESMAFLALEDAGGQVEVLVFPRTLARAGRVLDSDQPVLVVGRVSRQDEELKVVAEHLLPLRERNRVILTVPRGMDRDALSHLKAQLEASPGIVPVYLKFESGGSLVRTDPRFWVRVTGSLRRQLAAVLGSGRIAIEGDDADQ